MDIIEKLIFDDGLLNLYTIFIVFFLIVIHLIAIYNILHLKRVISNTTKLKDTRQISKNYYDKLDFTNRFELSGEYELKDKNRKVLVYNI